MKFKMTKETAQAMAALGAGLGLGAIIRYAELKAQLAYEKAERLENEIENINLAMKIQQDDIDRLKGKVESLELSNHTKEDKVDLFGNLK